MKNLIFTKSILLLSFAFIQQIAHCDDDNGFDFQRTETQFYELLTEDTSKADSLADVLINEQNDPYQIGLGHYYKGEIAYHLSEWTTGAEQYQKSIDYLSNLDDKKRLSAAYNNLGCSFLYLSLFNKALEALTLSLEYELSAEDIVGISQSYQNIALVYDRQNNIEKAIEYNLLALNYLIDTEFEEELAGVYNNLAALYSDERNYEEAEFYYIKAIDIYKHNDNSNKHAKVLSNFGNLKVKQGKYDEGSDILEQALALFRIDNDIFSEASVYEMIADMHAFKNNYDQALFYSKLAYEKAQETDSYFLKLSTLYSLYLYYRKTENWKEALEKFEVYNYLKDTLLSFDQSAHNEILQIELTHTLQKTEFLNMHAEKTKLKFQALAIIILIFTFLIIIFFFRLRKLKKDLYFVSREHHLNKKRTKFSLQSFLPKQNVQAEKVLEYLPILTELLEKTIDSTENIFVTIKNEIDYICTFVALCKNLYNKEIKFRLETNIPENRLNSIIVPTMLFKPSIDHLLFCPDIVNKELDFNVSFMVKDNKLDIIYEDSASKPFYKKYDRDGIISESEIMLIKKRMKQMSKPGKNFIFKGVFIEDDKTRFGYSFPLVYC
ncbi:MAG: tetratricopeptide repeat protein [Marinilabiliaceae bacterium]|nr:tetratricopeptide repeat protein [Marinilabiliaceae bacterium]